MKKFFILFVAFSTAHAFGCDRPVDNSKVVFFVDTNYSDLEIDTARRAACNRGERLVVAPRNYRDHTRFLRPLAELEERANRCWDNDSAPGCSTTMARYEQLENEYATFRQSQPSVMDSVRQELNELKRSGAKIQNFTISGHDGGGGFGGHKGNFGRHDLSQMIGEYPEQDQVKSVMLLGCYTGVQEEILAWKSIFPDVRMIAGYDGSAPLSTRPLGHQYLEDLLRREPALISQASAARAQAYATANVRGLASMNTALYLNLQCEEEIYYSSGEGRRFARFSPSDEARCSAQMQEIYQIYQVYETYNSGQVEPPAVDAGSPLNIAYRNARQASHCMEVLGLPVNAEVLLGLRFINAYEENFARYFADDLTRVAALLRDLPEPHKSQIWIPNSANLAAKSRRQLMENIFHMNGALASQSLSADHRRALDWLKMASEKHLQNFRSPLTWHELGAGMPEPVDTPRFR